MSRKLVRCGILYFLEVYDYYYTDKLIGTGYIVYTDEIPYGPYLVDTQGIKLNEGWYNIRALNDAGKLVPIIETIQ